MEYSTHKVYINQAGKEVPSATTILKLLNKPSLVKWANYLGFKRTNTKDVVERASEIGTLTHNCIEALLTKERFEFPKEFDHHKESVMKRMNGFLNWYKEVELAPKYIEKELVCDEFGGTVDFFGELNSLNTVLDYKSSNKIYSSMFLQLGCYIYMLETVHGERVDQAGIVHVSEKGTKVIMRTREQMQQYVEMFLVLSKFFHGWYDLNKADGWGKLEL